MRRYLPAALSLVAGLLLGGLVLIWAGPPASAFVPPKVRPPSVEEVRIAKEVLKLTREGGTQAQRDTARKVVTRAMQKAVPRALPYVVGKGGLVGAAAGVWTVVGLELYYMPCWECETNVLKYSSDLRMAQGSQVATGYVSDGAGGYVLSGATVLTYHSWRVDGGDLITVVATSVGTRKVVQTFGRDSERRCMRTGLFQIVPGGAGSPGVTDHCETNYPGQVADPVIRGGVVEKRQVGASQPQEVRGYEYDSTGNFQQSSTIPLGAAGQKVTPPTYESGAVSDGAPASGPTVKTTASEGNQFISSVVADPETETLPIPDYPPNWDDLPDPPADPYENPDADPDKDGTPNRTDDDPEGDGDPDGDGNPNEHPRVTPYPENPDTDGDGDPDSSDPDDDNDGRPDTDDPNPYVADPPPDADQDGEPDQSDPDDDNDGIPDTDDPEPKTPTNPATLPKDHPYADPDGDGEPNKDDPDNDGDGTPDTEDPEPNNPEVGAPDLDRDGIPDKSDGDQDGDDVPDWEDVERRTQAVPNQTPDGDDDGVPDWSDPWPGNPYAPADPTKDGDSDDVPDYKDPEPAQPNVPMSPWAPGSPGDVPNNPGEPNIPANPTNPNHPPSSSTPAEPTDPSSPLDPNAPINPSAPENPGEPGGPPGEGDGCPVARQSAFKLPTIEVASVFPFNLVVWCYGAVASLHKPPSAPEWEVPFLGTMNLSTQEGLFGAVRTVLTSLILIALVMGWYSYIKGSEA